MFLTYIKARNVIDSGVDNRFHQNIQKIVNSNIFTVYLKQNKTSDILKF